MCKVLLSVLLAEFDFSTPDSIIEPRSAQMGGVSRASGDVVVRYSRKSLVQTVGVTVLGQEKM